MIKCFLSSNLVVHFPKFKKRTPKIPFAVTKPCKKNLNSAVVWQKFTGFSAELQAVFLQIRVDKHRNKLTKQVLKCLQLSLFSGIANIFTFRNMLYMLIWGFLSSSLVFDWLYTFQSGVKTKLLLICSSEVTQLYCWRRRWTPWCSRCGFHYACGSFTCLLISNDCQKIAKNIPFAATKLWKKLKITHSSAQPWSHEWLHNNQLSWDKIHKLFFFLFYYW